MALQNRPLLYTATGLLVITAVLYITANALPIWVTVSDESYSYTVGLWKACESEGSTKLCINIPLKSDYKTISTRAFITLCCIYSSLSVASIITILCINENLENISSLAKGLAIAALICRIIGVAIGISVVLEGIDFGGKMGVSCVF
ncbi:unnamed protein product [Adineta steineri]|uniref:Uncharacterized protein n=1 Tax=Adineta steineri TaxID=433720 RepID=A0A816FYT6_9BILA|nr:unnamed protein product [Adineta steineri]CAF1568930.1 unnamed protein product [Adineta steineri]CAF1667898.1 unnamed protein product [Adineta steineri]CAF1667910.1 unnamed protein product [Adineta steineri]